MKSDQEFLKGVYEKAKEMELSEQQKMTGENSRKGTRSASTLRYAVTAAACFILVSAGVFKFVIDKPASQVTPQPISIDVRGIDLEGDGQEAQQGDLPGSLSEKLRNLFEAATDIVEVVKSTDGEKAYEIVRTYRNDSGEKDQLSKLKGILPQLEKGQRAVLFLKEEAGNVNMLDSFVSSTNEDTYQNSSGDVITKEELSEIKN